MGIEDGIAHRVPGRRFDHGGAIPFRGEDDRTHTAFVAERTISFLGRQDSQPFLCIAGFYSPHSPWVVPQQYLDLYNPRDLAAPDLPPDADAHPADGIFSDEGIRSAKHGYYAMVSEVDHHIGRILNCLDETGLREHTIVIFTSDHGEWMGEHYRYGKGYPGHDAVSRVPLVINWEGLGRRAAQPVSSIVEAIDVLPTVLDLAGIQIPPQVQGVSLRPVIEGTPDGARSSALTEMSGWKTVRMSDVRYVVESSGAEQLFDLRADPLAYCDVAAEPAYASLLDTARREMILRLLDRERPLPRAWAY
jgi:arylsulfatase A-like enzyme